MKDSKDQQRGTQEQTSQQSAEQGGQSGAGSRKSQSARTPAGIGASQGQDEASGAQTAGTRPRPARPTSIAREAGVRDEQRQRGKHGRRVDGRFQGASLKRADSQRTARITFAARMIYRRLPTRAPSISYA